MWRIGSACKRRGGALPYARPYAAPECRAGRAASAAPAPHTDPRRAGTVARRAVPRRAAARAGARSSPLICAAAAFLSIGGTLEYGTGSPETSGSVAASYWALLFALHVVAFGGAGLMRRVPGAGAPADQARLDRCRGRWCTRWRSSPGIVTNRNTPPRWAVAGALAGVFPLRSRCSSVWCCRSRGSKTTRAGTVAQDPVLPAADAVAVSLAPHLLLF